MSEEERSRKPSRYEGYLWLIGVAAAVGSIFVTAFFPSTVLLPLAIGLLVTIILFQITEVRERSSINRVIGVYEEVRKDGWLHGKMADITVSYFEIVNKITHPRYVHRAKELIAVCRDNLNALSLGQLEVPVEGEASFTIGLASECKEHLLAVSYKDEEWWSSALGEKYLEKHKELIQKGGNAERVFIVQGAPGGDGLSKLKDTLDKQAALGIKVYVVYEGGPQPLPEPLLSDFVIYDDKYVRTGAFEHGILRKAILSINDADKTLAKQRFEELRDRSQPWTPSKSTPGSK